MLAAGVVERAAQEVLLRRRDTSARPATPRRGARPWSRGPPSRHHLVLPQGVELTAPAPEQDADRDHGSDAEHQRDDPDQRERRRRRAARARWSVRTRTPASGRCRRWSSPPPPCSRSDGARRWRSWRSTGPPTGRCTTDSARPASMTAARCATVCGDESNTPLPIRRATPRTTGAGGPGPTAAPVAVAGGRLLRHGRTPPVGAGGLQEGVEVLLGGRPLEHRRDAPGRVHHERRRRRGDAVALGDRAARVAHRRPQVAVLAQERARRRRRVVEHDAHHLGAVRRVRLLVMEAREVRRLLLARGAPAGEEVDHHVVAAQRRPGTPARPWSGPHR